MKMARSEHLEEERAGDRGERGRGPVDDAAAERHVAGIVGREMLLRPDLSAVHVNTRASLIGR